MSKISMKHSSLRKSSRKIVTRIIISEGVVFDSNQIEQNMGAI